MRRALGRLRREEDGVGLMELIVAMSISMVILVAVGGFFTATLRAGSTNTRSDQNARSASVVMNSLTRYVHAASLLPVADGTYAAAMTQADGSRMTFTAFVNLDGNATDVPVQVRYSLNGAKGLVLDRWTGTTTKGFTTFPAPTQPPTTSTVLGGAVSSPTGDGDPLFTYLGANGAALPTLADGSLAASQLGAVRAVRVNLELGAPTADTPGNTHIQNTLYLFNVAYGTGTGATP